MADIMFAGIGGQGVLTAGKILIQIAAENGKNVSWTSEYSAEMRGGIALCRVVVSDEEIGSPYPDQLDVLVCMNEDAYNTYIDQVADGGKVIINKSIFSEREYPEHVEVIGVDAIGISNELENSRGANLVMMGAMIEATNMMDKQQFSDTLKDYFDHKGKPSEKNVQCFNLGYEKAEKI
ncbi:MAG TPA: 2-oxoacid:acceptor oxidoreductase family protein [Candidatus Anaerostipes excrementavium]|uniref:2-oxoacid:acceptor oxidoreductase family protein n=1 Tax=Candidatus Anaerostipes excrementavium TaxID=2838463 RepID=A0A9D2B841_9FIRM|nr:2-oxoacid:acceptor oxidoreductase family protein [uncultured Anaerostipes sp.]HIX66775.1 2-oxoacid:acceptor oxidoreductase family protein [Candidatus Anaerostipes excrementavium]